jgi:hypothetical protein
MSNDTDKSLFIGSPLHAPFYQQLISAHVGFQELGTRLVRCAEHAYVFRRVERVEETATLLINVPIRQYQLIGQYYLGWCEYVRGADVKRTFERIAEHAPLRYRARAMLALATLAARKKDSASELGWIMESMKVSPSLEGLRGMAVLKAREGFHNSSIKDLESGLPFARYADPLSHYDYLNSYAVELGEAGRMNEARNVSRIVLASPLAFAYPDWQETARDLKEADRPSVNISPIPSLPHNVVHMPVAEYVKSERVRYNQPARVLNLQQWKTKMGKADGNKPPETPTLLQIVNQIILFYTNKNTTDEQRYKMWEAVAKIMSQPDPSKTGPDDSEGA